MNRKTLRLTAALIPLILLVITACNKEARETKLTVQAQGVGNTYNSRALPMGQGQISTYLKVAQSGVPSEIGLKFNAAALNGLPTQASDGLRCYDMNADGQIDLHMECAGGHEFILPLPAQVQTLAKTPFKFAMVNYNPMGHQPPGVYDRPHFDMHFYTQSNAERLNIRLGACGEVIDCTDFNTATKPLAPGYMPPNAVNVGAAMGLMGNHLINPDAHEFHGMDFTHTWIWGVYDGKITYFEPMITRDYLLSKPQRDCAQYGMPQKFHQSGYYPTQYCIAYNAGLKEYTVSLERFKWYGQ